MQFTNLFARFSRTQTARRTQTAPRTRPASRSTEKGSRARAVSSELRPILLRMADLEDLDQISMGLFHDMRELIVNQDDPGQRLSMAERLQKLLQTRFQATYQDVEGWKQAMSQRWTEARDRQFRGFSSVGIAAAFRPFYPSEEDNDNPPQASLRLRTRSTSSEKHLYQARDTNGTIRMELQVLSAGQGWLSSFDLRTGRWVKRSFSFDSGLFPQPRDIRSLMQRTAYRCGWELARA